MGLLALGWLFKNYKWPLKQILIILLVICLKIYISVPDQGFRTAGDWKYEDELKAAQIIKTENPGNFNVTNLVYDNKATTQKYFLARDDIKSTGEDYMNNKYLFVISRGDNYPNDPAYEVNSFKPFKVLKIWKINGQVNLYLAERKVKV